MSSVLVDALLAPLKFAARNDFANVARLAGFENLATSALAKTAHPAIAELVRGFDAAALDERQRRVRALLVILTSPSPGTSPGAPLKAVVDPLAFPVDKVKGVGPKRASALMERGLSTIGDVLFTLPRAWQDRRATQRIADLEAGVVVAVSGTVAASGAVGFGGRGRRYEVVIDDGSGTLRLVFFHFRLPEMQKRFPKGTVVTASGEVARYGPRLQMTHPRVGSGERTDEMGGVHPVYPEVLGMHPLDLARAAQACLEAVERAGGVPDPLPESVRKAGRVIGLGEALRVLHTPLSDVDAETLRALVERRSPAHRRLAFEELFVLGTALALRRRSALVEPAPALVHDGDVATLEGTLPFAPTNAQRRVVDEIARDLARSVPMARLLQGDVGSGKTAVAAAACLRAVRAGHQAAFMAPTELLAEQHGRTLKRMFSPLGVRVEVITGSMGKKARAIAEARLRNRDLDVAVGTQALLSEGVEFARLGLCIADEQHRFGVVQRAALRAKTGKAALMPHLLVMTATPIPRSLALTVYGDLAVSVLDEMPPGRTPVATRATSSVDDVHAAIKAALDRNERAFVVHPLIEESPAAGDLAAATAGFEQLCGVFGAENVALLHGKLSVKDRDAAMARFIRGDARVLVATTIIEVGVDVPEATLMVVMNAERFGLAQLHQLRGRVGRSSRRSECVLVIAGGGEDAQKRVQVLCETNDGFRIAEEDLMLRGAGDVLGTRQSGLPSLAFSDLVRHAPLIEQTRQLADALVDVDPALARQENAGLKKLVHERYAARLALTSAG